MSILIVEDDMTSARIIELILKKHGYNYHVAENGREALDHLLVTPHVRLVVSDIMMPEMDGLELLDNLKHTREFQDIPVIMCTTHADIEIVKQAVKTGCGDYIIKPVNPLQLLRKIERLLEQDTPALLEYRDLVSQRQVDRNTYTEAIKIFSSMLDKKLRLVELYLKKNKPMPAEKLEDFPEKCGEIGAMRLHNVLVKAKTLLADQQEKPGNVIPELRLIRREMQMLQHYLPKTS